MKILCVCDQIDPLVYSEGAKERFKDIDLILCAGDLPMEYVDFIVSTLNKNAYFIFGNHNLDEFGVYHKVGDKKIEVKSTDMKFCHGAVYLGFRAKSDKDFIVSGEKATPLLVAGASGSARYNDAPNQYSERGMFLRLLCLLPRLLLNKILYGRYLDIFLTHAAPRHVHDKEDLCHRGFECFNWFIRHFKPRYFVHGHIHLYDLHDERVSLVGETEVINAYSHFVIEYPECTYKGR